MPDSAQQTIAKLANLYRSSILAVIAGNSVLHMRDPDHELQSIGFMQAIANQGMRGVLANDGIIIGIAICHQNQPNSHITELDLVLQKIANGELDIPIDDAALILEGPGYAHDGKRVPGNCWIIGIHRSDRITDLIEMQWNVENRMTCPHSDPRPTEADNEHTANVVNQVLDKVGDRAIANPTPTQLGNADQAGTC